MRRENKVKLNRGGIVECLGLRPQSCETPAKHNQNAHSSDQPAAWESESKSCKHVGRRE